MGLKRLTGCLALPSVTLWGRWVTQWPLKSPNKRNSCLGKTGISSVAGCSWYIFCILADNFQGHFGLSLAPAVVWPWTTHINPLTHKHRGGVESALWRLRGERAICPEKDCHFIPTVCPSVDVGNSVESQGPKGLSGTRHWVFDTYQTGFLDTAVH